MRTGGILDIRNYWKGRFKGQNPKLDGLGTWETEDHSAGNI